MPFEIDAEGPLLPTTDDDGASSARPGSWKEKRDPACSTMLSTRLYSNLAELITAALHDIEKFRFERPQRLGKGATGKQMALEQQRRKLQQKRSSTDDTDTAEDPWRTFFASLRSLQFGGRVSGSNSARSQTGWTPGLAHFGSRFTIAVVRVLSCP